MGNRDGIRADDIAVGVDQHVASSGTAPHSCDKAATSRSVLKSRRFGIDVSNASVAENVECSDLRIRHDRKTRLRRDLDFVGADELRVVGGAAANEYAGLAGLFLAGILPAGRVRHQPCGGDPDDGSGAQEAARTRRDCAFRHDVFP